MPPVFIQPGLGESLNRFLERLGRRGEEQRALQAERNNIQASMDARAAEVRTRMLSQTIDQSIGLFTNEMQRDRASERRLGEAENLQYLKGKPGRTESQASAGLTTLWQGGELQRLNKELGIPTLLSRAYAQINGSLNTLMPKEKNARTTAHAELQEYATAFLNDKLSNEHYARASLKAIEDLSNINPSGPPKQTLQANTLIGTGPRSAGGNGLAEGLTFSIDKDGEPTVLVTGLEKMIEERMSTLHETINPEWYEWKVGGKKGKEPQEFVDYDVAFALAAKDVMSATLLQQISHRNVSAEKLAEIFKALEALERKGPPRPDQQLGPASPGIRSTGSKAFEGETDASLRKKWEKGGRKPITWPNPVEYRGQEWEVTYHDGKLHWKPYQRKPGVGTMAPPMPLGKGVRP